MDKGTRVRIVKGRNGVNQAGTVFWEGPNKYGSGTRLGIEGDDGQTYWIATEYVEEIADAVAAVVEEPTLERGMRVQWQRGEETGTGEVFWLGTNKRGPGTRVGVRDDVTQDAVWLPASCCTPSDASAAKENRPSPGRAPTRTDDDMPPMAPLPQDIDASSDELPPMAPLPDDGDIPYFEEEEEIPYNEDDLF